MIRNVLPSDAAQIAQIYNHYVLHTTVSFETEPLTKEQMLERITSIAAAHPYFVLEEQGVIIGYAYAHPWKERAAYSQTWEATVYIHKDHLGRGLGSLLFEKLIADCRAAGCHTLISCITADNSASILMQERYGFRKASHFTQVGFKFGRYLDVVDFELVL